MEGEVGDRWEVVDGGGLRQVHAACSCVLISKDQEGRQSVQGCIF